MKRDLWRLLLVTLGLLALTLDRGAAEPAGVAQSRAAASRGPAFLAVDLKAAPGANARSSYPTLVIERPDLIDTPILPGSIAKIVTLAAAMESGLVNSRTTIVCTREVTVPGHRLVCAHPDLHRALRPDEALAHSCNSYFSSIAAKLPRSAFDAALRSLGLPPSDPQVPVSVAAFGVEGNRATPRALLAMVERVARPGGVNWKPETLAVVRDGLRGAATYGTAAAISVRGFSGLAKTGTTVGASGVSTGVVAGVTTNGSVGDIGFVLVASGATGADAAALAADRLRSIRRPTTGTPNVDTLTLKIGLARTRTPQSGTATGQGTYEVRNLNLEDYVAGVVAGEAAPGSSPAALEALAITARTFALANRGRHVGDGFDLCDLTHCQVFGPSTIASRRATAATSGQVLLDGNKPASVFYTASCGGHTERPSAVWPGAEDPAYLPERPDPACAGERGWTSELTPSAIERALRAGGFKGDALRDLKVLSRDGSGRVGWLRIDGFAPVQISGEDFRTLVGRTLGWQQLKSTLFDVGRIGSGFRFTGRGSGHGVGLCVVGSVALAAQGQSAQAILHRYFPGLEISPRRTASRPDLVPAGIVLGLPSEAEKDRSALLEVIEGSRADLERSLGVRAPQRIVLRFHPTVESFQRATGQPWFTAGATTNSGADFIPVDVLRKRGLLERTIRHEMTHILTGPALKGRPLWVVEGIAAYYAGEVPGDAGRGSNSTAMTRSGSVDALKCPADNELRRPASQQSLGDAYARAGTCVANQLKQGRRWSEIQ